MSATITRVKLLQPLFLQAKGTTSIITSKRHFTSNTMNHQKSEDSDLPTRGLIRQEDTTEHLAQKLCLLPLNTIHDLRSMIRLNMLKHYQNLDEEWLLDRYRIHNTINSEMLSHFRITSYQLDLEASSGPRNLNFNFNSILNCYLNQKPDQGTYILAQHLYLNHKTGRTTHEAQPTQPQIAIQSLKTETKDEIIGNIIVINGRAHCNKGKRNPIYTFPYTLHEILSNPDYSDCISWLPHGRAWKILRRTQLERDVLPHHFRHGRHSSFMRQVNGWGFQRIVEGPDQNAYYHKLFVKDFPQLCLQMQRPSEYSKP